MKLNQDHKTFLINKINEEIEKIIEELFKDGELISDEWGGIK